ncbi:hypothetical protein [Candidatus Parabeggiatoa sp. HSG14]|uniref:hypothetical protein n=1 Tax=Candidatus Parabeggiatoa sp. HSG14 TaxID=3055593 RepID=UPI0032E404AB
MTYSYKSSRALTDSINTLATVAMKSIIFICLSIMIFISFNMVSTVQAEDTAPSWQENYLRQIAEAQKEMATAQTQIAKVVTQMATESPLPILLQRMEKMTRNDAPFPVLLNRMKEDSDMLRSMIVNNCVKEKCAIAEAAGKTCHKKEVKTECKNKTPGTGVVQLFSMMGQQISMVGKQISLEMNAQKNALDAAISLCNDSTLSRKACLSNVAQLKEQVLRPLEFCKELSFSQQEYEQCVKIANQFKKPNSNPLKLCKGLPQSEKKQCKSIVIVIKSSLGEKQIGPIKSLAGIFVLAQRLRVDSDFMRIASDKPAGSGLFAGNITAALNEIHYVLSVVPEIVAIVRDLNFKMGIMVRDVDSSMGRMGRMMPGGWGW